MGLSGSIFSGFYTFFGRHPGDLYEQPSHISRAKAPMRSSVTKAEIEDLLELESVSPYLKEEALRNSETLERHTLTMIRGALYQAN